MSVLAAVFWAGTDWQEWMILARNGGLLFLASWATYQVLLKLNLAKKTRWEHRVITCLILFMLFDAVVAWWVFPLLGVVTELLQRLLRIKTGPVANPAALGALVVGTTTGELPTWWATNFGPRFFDVVSLGFILTLVAGSYIVWRYKKQYLVGALLVMAGLVFWGVIQASPVFLLGDGTLLFFAMIMATEPKTSPAVPAQQVVFGAAVGTLSMISLRLGLAEPFTAGLVAGNLGFNGHRWWQLRQRLQKARSGTS